MELGGIVKSGKAAALVRDGVGVPDKAGFIEAK